MLSVATLLQKPPTMPTPWENCQQPSPMGVISMSVFPSLRFFAISSLSSNKIRREQEKSKRLCGGVRSVRGTALIPGAG